AGAEAVPALAVRVDVERRRALLVKGARRSEALAGLLQARVTPNDLDDIETCFDVVYRGHGAAPAGVAMPISSRSASIRRTYSASPAITLARTSHSTVRRPASG